VINIACPKCEKAHELPKSYEGSTFLCSECGECIDVPGGDEPPAPPSTAISQRRSSPASPKATINKRTLSHAIKRETDIVPKVEMELAPLKERADAAASEKPAVPKEKPEEKAETPEQKAEQPPAEDEGIEVRCDDCQRTYRVPPKKAGGKLRCLGCGKLLEVPAGSEKPARPAKAPKKKDRKDAEDDGAPVYKVKAERTSKFEDKKPPPWPPRWAVTGLVAAVALAGVGTLGILGYNKFSGYVDNSQKEEKLPPGVTPAMARLMKNQPPPSKAPTPPNPGSNKSVKPPEPPPEKGEPRPATHARGQEIYQQLLKSSTWVTVRAEGGQGLAFGSGALVDRTNRLILTNHHVVDRGVEILVYFPIHDKGKLVVDRTHYRQKLKPADQLPARVLAKDARLDLALIQVPNLPEGVVPVPIAARSPSPGEVVHSIGNPAHSDGLWVYTSGTVRQVYHKRWRPLGSSADLEAEVVETQSPTNPGDSGGPLVNESGELVGVTEGGSIAAQLMSFFIDVTDVTKFVERSCKANNLVWVRGEIPATKTTADILGLIKKLEDSDSLVRGKAAQALAEAGPSAKLAVPILIRGLKDTDPIYRKLAADALDKIGTPDKTDLALLQQSLRDETPAVRAYAAEALGKLGPEARSAAADLVGVLRGDTRATIRQSAARSLGRLGPDVKETVFPALVAALGDLEHLVRAAAAESITLLGTLPDSDQPTVLAMLKHQDIDVRIHGVQALAQFPGQGKTIVPVLLETIRDGGDIRVRRAALVSLAHFVKDAKKEAVPLFATIIKDGDAELRQAVCPLLLQLGAEAKPLVPTLAECLAAADAPTRSLFLEVLHKLGPDAKEAVPALKKLLADKDREQLLQVLPVLGAMGKEARDAAPAMMGLFEEKDPEVRDATVEALARIGKAVTPLLVSGMRDRDGNVRLGAVRVAGKLGPDARALAPALSILAQTDPVVSVRSEAADAWKKVVGVQQPMPMKK
jgi:HEAT repeat protein/S1-C subfamily serine protease